jgi:DeoR/GlpR family transcriptional regulator of sugar metabolism
MLAAERQRVILNLIRQQGRVTVTELGERFIVSPNTIRRDLQSLQKSGLVTVVHGGALYSENNDSEIPFPKRQVSEVNQKNLIGARAAQLIGENEAIILDAGTTTQGIARVLHSRQDLTVLTNALNIALELEDSPGIVTILAGGVIRAKSNCLIGTIAERTFSEWHVNKAFLSAGGIDLEIGLTNPNPFEVPIKQAMIKAAQQVILVAGSEKFGRCSLVPFAPLAAIHTIVTDNQINSEIAAKIRDLGIDLIIVGEEI